MLPLQIQDLDVERLEQADSTTRAKISETLNELTHMPLDDALVTVTNSLVSAGMKILLAIVIFIVGRWLIKKLVQFMGRVFERRHVEVSLRSFLMSLTKTVLMIILIITVIGVMGLNTTSFIAIFASAGLALGIALSGTLQNFAGGVMILLIKPYRVGDYIETQEEAGTVKSIMLFHTVINTPDNQTIMIPNGGISTGIINNYSTEATRRVEWLFNVAYGEDFDKAAELIRKLLDKDGRVLSQPAYTIAINDLAESSLEIVVRVWVKASDFWDVFYDINRQVYIEFPENGIDFPFQQIDINLINKGGQAKDRLKDGGTSGTGKTPDGSSPYPAATQQKNDSVSGFPTGSFTSPSASSGGSGGNSGK